MKHKIPNHIDKKNNKKSEIYFVIYDNGIKIYEKTDINMVRLIKDFLTFINEKYGGKILFAITKSE